MEVELVMVISEDGESVAMIAACPAGASQDVEMPALAEEIARAGGWDGAEEEG